MKQCYMGATIMPVKNTPRPLALLDQLRADYPEFVFVEGGQFSWHAGKHQVSYLLRALDDMRGIWALLHEIGHALLKHTTYDSDVELLQIEVTAWEKAKELAAKYHVPINDDYIQDCLDSYRDWLHVRATCPTCHSRALQVSRHTYRCHNCGDEWQVSPSRLCRPYRRRG